LSSLWPGLGQLYVGRRRAALVFALPVFILVLLAARELLPGLELFALSMVSPKYVLAVLVIIVLDGLWRVLSLLHAYISGARQVRPRSRIEGGVVAVLLIAVIAMHLVPGYYAWSVYAAEAEISAASDVAFDDQGPLETFDPSEMPVMTTPTPGPWVIPNPSRRPDRRETILIVGVDSGRAGLDNGNTDTMMLVSLDFDTNKVSMISVPRDTTMFELYWNHATLGPTFKLNKLSAGIRWKSYASGDDPMTTLEKEIGYLLGIPVDYYVSLNMSGFVMMIDVVGGVDVVNPKAFYDDEKQQGWPAGKLHMDGTEALAYVQSRHGDNDYRRAARQQDVIVALEKKLSSPSMLAKLPKFLSAAGKAIHTDYPLDQVKDRAILARSLPADAIEKCVLGPPYSVHPPMYTTGGKWTSQLDMGLVASLSVYMFGEDSAYYGTAQPKPCAS
jgi:LCP family protein required for cell wall assembly